MAAPRKPYGSVTGSRAGIGTCLGGALIMVTLGVVASALAYTIGHHPPELDAALCPVGNPPATHVSFLIDATDPLEERQARDIVERVRQALARLKVGDRLSLYLLRDPSPDGAPQELFSACRPPRGDQVTRFDSNPEQVEARYTERFAAPLESALAELARTHGPAESSPIIEALYWIGHYSAGFGSAPAPARELVIVSDLLQKSPLLSHFQSKAYSFEALANTGSAYLDPGALAGTRVQILLLDNRYLARQAPQRRQEHAQFWDRYFTAMRAVLMTSLPPPNTNANANAALDTRPGRPQTASKARKP